MSSTVLAFAIVMAAGLGMLAGAFFAHWLWLDIEARHKYQTAKRALHREVTAHEIDNAAAKQALARVRAHRTELLTLLDLARQEAAERRAEAMAREEQIRRQVADSGFGRL